MAGTRNKQTQLNFNTYQFDLQRQSSWNSPQMIQSPAYPCSGINVQRIPAMDLATNSVDIETYLYGIGANNYVFPTALPPLDLKKLPVVSFTPTPDLYLPILPPLLQKQRP
jgi:hypothetical protein